MTAPPLPFTGERYVPDAPNAKGEMWYEHWHRYHYVLPLVAGKAVLDVASGEGYGSALMSRVAAAVTGVDVSAEAIAHGREAYAGRPNLTLVEASCTALPFADASFDVVVSFETIEHIAAQADFLDQVKRVLKPGGLFLLSSPNKAEYADKRGYANEFHVKELYRPELEALLAARFAGRRWLSQRNAFVSLIAPEDGAAGGESLTVSQATSTEPAAPLPALYDLVACSDDTAALAALPLRVSVFSDAEEWAYADYRNTYRKYVAAVHELNDLRAKLAARDTTPAPSPADSWLTRLIKRLST